MILDLDSRLLYVTGVILQSLIYCLKLKNNLTSEEIEEYKKIIEKYRYPYTPNIIEGQPYIDQSTIKLAINNKKR